MTDDIVKRLQKLSYPEARDAAAEIERLRERVRELAKALDDLLDASITQCFPSSDEDFEVLNKARAALRGEDDAE